MSDTSNKTVSLTTFAGDYDPNDFIIPISDEKGHNVRLGFRAPPGYVRRVDVVLSSRKFPYKTSSDLLRHAAHRHLKWLERQGDFDLELIALELVNDVVRRKKDQITFAKSAGALVDTATELERMGGRDEAKALILDALGKVSQMKKTALTRWYQDEVTKRSGHLIQD